MSQKAKTLARRLLRKNRGTRKYPGRSWRVIAREDFNDAIPAGTLCRFALSEGEWIPKDVQLQIVLGLKHAPRRKLHHMPKDLWDMGVDALRQALEKRETMPPPDPRVMKAFVKLGWLERVP